MSCKECLHYEICEIMSDQYGIPKVPPSQCGFYKLTADVVEVRHGHWVVCGTFDDFLTCSVCNSNKYPFGYGFAYCPNCGARMDGERREE